MIDLDVLSAKHGIGEGVALPDGDGGEVDAVGDIAHGIDRRYGALRIGIDLDGHVGRHVHAEAVKPKARHVGNAAGGEHDVVCTEARAVIQGDAHAGA